jgi:hypothetical protein
MHVIEDQLKREGVSTTFPILLAEATFAGNCLTHVGGVTPYQVVYGRQPSMLPPIAITTGEDIDEPGAGNDRVEARVREVALQAMIESTSQARISRALNTKTQLPGERMFAKGDIVEYHQPSATKDSSGWLGPANVKEVQGSQGQVVIDHNGNELRCRFQDVRHFLGLGWLVEECLFINGPQAMKIVKEFIEKLEPKSAPMLFGHTNKTGKMLTKASQTYKEIHEALNYVIMNVFRINDVMSVRIGRGVQTLGNIPDEDNHVTMYWFGKDDTHNQFIDYINKISNTVFNLKRMHKN